MENPLSLNKENLSPGRAFVTLKSLSAAEPQPKFCFNAEAAENAEKE